MDASAARRWEHFEHMADIGVRGIGPSREAAFEEAALALCATITDPELVRPDVLFEVACNAKEDEFLLVDWLNALITEMSAHRMIFSSQRGKGLQFCLPRRWAVDEPPCGNEALERSTASGWPGTARHPCKKSVHARCGGRSAWGIQRRRCCGRRDRRGAAREEGSKALAAHCDQRIVFAHTDFENSVCFVA